MTLRPKGWSKESTSGLWVLVGLNVLYVILIPTIAWQVKLGGFLIGVLITLLFKRGNSKQQAELEEAKKALQDKGLAYEEIVLGKDATTTAVRAITGKATAPQVFIGGQYIGGSEDLEAYLAKN